LATCRSSSLKRVPGGGNVAQEESHSKTSKKENDFLIDSNFIKNPLILL
jgi:hypothetical protein